MCMIGHLMDQKNWPTSLMRKSAPCRRIGARTSHPHTSIASLPWHEVFPDHRSPPTDRLPRLSDLPDIHGFLVTEWCPGTLSTKTEKPKSLAGKGFRDGVPRRIRTCDAGIRRPVLRGLRCLPDALLSLYINRFEVSEHLRGRSQNTHSILSW